MMNLNISEGINQIDQKSLPHIQENNIIDLKTEDNDLNVNSETLPENENNNYIQYLKIEYYQKYFNVPESEILVRIKKALTPWKNTFFDTARQLPDLYGPFWILTTIIFLLSSIGNLTAYFTNGTKSAYLFKFEFVRYGFAIVYSFGYGIPGLLYVLFKAFELNLNIFQIICFYGYSLVCIIPILLLCMIPISAFEWILMIYGILNSSAFLISNLAHELEVLSKLKNYIINFTVVCCQIALFLLLKFIFFSG